MTARDDWVENLKCRRCPDDLLMLELNRRLSLRSVVDAIAFRTGQLPASGPSLRSRQAIIFRLAALCIFTGRRGKLSIISGDGLTGIPSLLLFFEVRRQTVLLILKSSRPASSLLSERAILSLQSWCMDEQFASLLS
jgi:hypothetical protein